MRFNIVFATTPDMLFGLDDNLPWNHMKDDMLYFNKITTNIFNKYTIIMGANTWNSLEKPLPNRYNVVISSKSILKDGYDYRYESIEDFINNYPNNSKCFIIGGKTLIEDCIIGKYKNIIKNVYYNIILTNHKSFDDTNKKIYLDEKINDALNKYETNKKITENIIYHKITFPKHQEFEYLDLIKKSLHGDFRDTRNSKTFSIFSDKITFDLKNGFPLLTTKKLFIRGIFEELMFFLRGQTNSKILEDKKVNIWKMNTTKEFIEKCGLPYEEGDMGAMYGWNWNHFGADYIDCHTDYTMKGFNQIEYVLKLLITDPYSRRIIMTDYNPATAHLGVLYPCHSIVIQFYVVSRDSKYYVSMNMYQRSVDTMLGLPFNIASNGLLLHLVCSTLNQKVNDNTYIPDKLNLFLGDIHIYESHLEGALEQIKRIPYDFPKLNIKKKYLNIRDYHWDDIELIDYNSHPAIKLDMIA